MVHLEKGTVDSIYSQSKKRVIVEIKMCTFFRPLQSWMFCLLIFQITATISKKIYRALANPPPVEH